MAFVPGSSSILLEGSDGGIFGTANANIAQEATPRPTWFNMDNGFNTIEFYAGDISGNFANDSAPVAVGGAQDNGPSSVTFPGNPTGARNGRWVWEVMDSPGRSIRSAPELASVSGRATTAVA